MKPQIIGFVVGLVVMPFALFAAAVSGGAGHGDYFAARLLFPAPMLAARLFHEISQPVVGLAALQFPLYGWMVGAAFQKERRMLAPIALGFHILTLALIFIFPDPNFS